MKFLVHVLSCYLLSSQVEATASSAALSPLTRVIDLLQSLSQQIEKEGAKEKDLYETFVCWAKSVVEQKTASNEAASSRIDMLETYIKDINAGRIEFTSERADTEKEIEELMGDMDIAKAAREKENADFLDAENEMRTAVAALDSAIQVLDEATKDHKQGVLVAMKSSLNGGMAALAKQQAALLHAVELGDRFLGKADSIFLHRLLTGDVPSSDWKKLNRKATFKMAYKARSFKIQEVLKNLRQTFETNLNEATKKEGDAETQYEKLKNSKQDQLDAAREALLMKETEEGAAGLSVSDAQNEVDALKKQVENDRGFISETQQSLATKKKEWQDRQELRSAELAAVSKAISILHNDDARNLFKKSFSSQGYSLVQTGRSAQKMQAANGAVVALRDAARKSGDMRLLTIAASLVEPDESVKVEFKPVLKAIDKMIAVLKDDEKKDLEIKESCETNRMADTRKVAKTSREIDEKTEHANKLVEEIKVLNQEIAKLLAEHQKVQDALDAASKIRQEENAAWKVANKDDEDAAATVFDATVALNNFYKENNLVLAQKKQPVSAAGEAPPPPPPTWEGGYGGKTGEAAGIIQILDMVRQDILEDQAKAKKEEGTAQKEYDDFKKNSDDQMLNLMDQKYARDSTKGSKESDLEQTQTQRGIKKGELNALMDKINRINPNCEYFEVNYSLRLRNRQIELDGLMKAKAILEGGVFDAPDPNREIKPGDAAAATFLQSRRR